MRGIYRNLGGLNRTIIGLKVRYNNPIRFVSKKFESNYYRIESRSTIRISPNDWEFESNYYRIERISDES